MERFFARYQGPSALINVVDSSGWIEYLQETPRADLFAETIEDHLRLLVPTIALYEVHKLLSPTSPPLK